MDAAVRFIIPQCRALLFLIHLGSARLHFLAGHRFTDHVVKEIRHVPGPSLSAQITVDHFTVKAVKKSSGKLRKGSDQYKQCRGYSKS
jgi:hypothetical protein